MTCRPNSARKDNVSNEKMILLRNVCWFARM